MNYSEIKKQITNLSSSENAEQKLDPKLNHLFTKYHDKLVLFYDDYDKFLSIGAKKVVKINQEYHHAITELQNLLTKSEADKYNQIKKNSEQANKNIKNLENLKKIENLNIKKTLKQLEEDFAAIIFEQDDIREKNNQLIADKMTEVEKIYQVNADNHYQMRIEQQANLDSNYQITRDEYLERINILAEYNNNQIKLLSPLREKAVNYNSEKYRVIKANQTAFSHAYNHKIDSIKNTYRSSIRKINDKFQKELLPLQQDLSVQNSDIEKQIDLIKAETKQAIEVYLNENEKLRVKYQDDKKLLNEEYLKEKAEIEQELILIKKQFEIENEALENKLKDIANEPAEIRSDLRSDFKSKQNILKRDLQIDQDLNRNKLIHHENKYKTNLKKLNHSFYVLLSDNMLEIDRLESKKDFDIENLNLKIKFHEEHSKHLIRQLENIKNLHSLQYSNEFEREVLVLETQLSLGSKNQEVLLQSLSEENNYNLADSTYQNHVIDYNLTIDKLNYEYAIKFLKLDYESSLALIYSEYQLSIQKEAIKRDQVLASLKADIEINELNFELKKNEISNNFEKQFLNLSLNSANKISGFDKQIFLQKQNTILKNHEISAQLEIIKAQNKLDLATEKVSRALQTSYIEMTQNHEIAQSIANSLIDLEIKNIDLIDILKQRYSIEPDMLMFSKLVQLSKDYLVYNRAEHIEITSFYRKIIQNKFQALLTSINGYDYLQKNETITNNYLQEENKLNLEKEKLQKGIDDLEDRLLTLNNQINLIQSKITQLLRDIKNLNRNNNQKSSAHFELEVSLKNHRFELIHQHKEYKITEKNIETKRRELSKFNQKFESLNQELKANEARLKREQSIENMILFKASKRLLNELDEIDQIIFNYYYDLDIVYDKFLKDLILTEKALDLFIKSTTILNNQFINDIFKYVDKIKDHYLSFYYRDTLEQHKFQKSIERNRDSLVNSINNNLKKIKAIDKKEREEYKHKEDLENKKKLLTHYNFKNEQQSLFNIKKNKTEMMIKSLETRKQEILIKTEEQIKVIDTNKVENDNNIIKENLRINKEYQLATDKEKQAAEIEIYNKSKAHQQLFLNRLAKIKSLYNNYINNKKEESKRLQFDLAYKVNKIKEEITTSNTKSQEIQKDIVKTEKKHTENQAVLKKNYLNNLNSKIAKTKQELVKSILID